MATRQADHESGDGLPDEVDLDGLHDVRDPNILYRGRARRTQGDKYRVLAVHYGDLCLVEVTVWVALDAVRRSRNELGRLHGEWREFRDVVVQVVATQPRLMVLPAALDDAERAAVKTGLSWSHSGAQ